MYLNNPRDRRQGLLPELSTSTVVSAEPVVFPFEITLPISSRSWHSRFQFDHLAIHRKPSVPVMVNGFRVLLCRITPSLENLQNKEIEFVDEMGIDYLAF
jgi:hypothetical protein